jgi:hypothetical protein
MAMLVSLILIALAGGLLAVVGFAVKELVQLDRLESREAVLRQMIDSGAAWARRRAADWPSNAGRPDCPRLAAEGIVPPPYGGSILLRPQPGDGSRVGRAMIEASLVDERGHATIRTAEISLAPP